MSFATTTQNDTAVIRVPARFDFRVVHDFNRSVDDATRAAGEEIIATLPRRPISTVLR